MAKQPPPDTPIAGPALVEALQAVMAEARPRPDDPPDEDAFVVMHDEFLAIMDDVRCGRDGVAMMARLLQDADDTTLLAHGAAAGLAALLDGVRTRLDLACDGLKGTAYQLGIDGVVP